MATGGGLVPGAAPGDAADVRVTVPADLDAKRLDRVLATLVPELSRSQLQRLISDGAVLVDGIEITKPSAVVAAGATLQVALRAEGAPEAPQAQDLQLEVLYEDDDMAIINKPAGLVVHAGAGRHESTLVDGLLHRFGERLSRVGGDDRPGIVHRLDKGTSGLIAVALNDDAHRAMAAQFAARTIEKEYTAIVYGCPKDDSGEIDLPLGRDRADRTKVSANTDRPRDAVSRWEVAEPLHGFAELRVFPRTGRMHQIRAHLTSIHHPCVGDEKYSGAQWKGVKNSTARNAARDFGRPALHARRLVIGHPETDEPLGFSAPLPSDIENLLDALRNA